MARERSGTESKPLGRRATAAAVAESGCDGRQFVALWLLALATYGVGDTLTTVAVIWFSDGVIELNALIRLAVDAFGFPGLVALKLLAFAGAIGISLVGIADDDRFLYRFPAVTFSVFGGFVTTHNLWLLLS